MSLGKRIKERRLAMGLTQEELGAKVGLGKPSISMYESGKTQNIGGNTLRLMAKELDCSADYLLGFEGKAKSPVKTEQSVWCADDTCKHNVNGRCGAKEVEMVVAQDDHYKTVVVCETYADKREQEDG